MPILKKENFDFNTNVLKQFQNNEDGSMVTTMAVSSTVIIGMMGLALDYATMSSADSRAQIIADNSALAAAIFVKNNGSQPANKEEGLIGQYTATELGYTYSSWTKGGSDAVTINVSYDNIKKEATATVSGKTVPLFSQVMGQNELNFEAKSVVKYYDIELKDPASIVLVLDNSGSMGWDDKRVVFRDNGSYYTPADAIPRITALENSVKNFMGMLNDLAGDQSAAPVGTRALRTGMLAYNSNTINARTVQMNWGTITDAQINAMTANGGTNSAPPMDTARVWMAAENAKHVTEHGRTPLKFAIFMTDGVNTSGGTKWVIEADTGFWRIYDCYNGCRYYYASEVTYPDYDFLGNGWEEGKNEMVANLDTLSDCIAMANSGVKVYTIGFALEEGYYEKNTTYNGQMQYEYTNDETSTSAYAFLQGCAFTTEEFIKAENAETLEDAFQTIGNNIVTEIVRISG